MNIAGKKVVLRTVEEQDRELLMTLIHDPEITKITGGYPHISSYDHQIRWFCSLSNFAEGLGTIIADREHPRIGLGVLILSFKDSEKGAAEIYIKLARTARRKGYGQDAVNTLVSYGFSQLGLTCIYANILEDNLGSRGLFESCGFRQENIHKNRSIVYTKRNEGGNFI